MRYKVRGKSRKWETVSPWARDETVFSLMKTWKVFLRCCLKKVFSACSYLRLKDGPKLKKDVSAPSMNFPKKDDRKQVFLLRQMLSVLTPNLSQAFLPDFLRVESVLKKRVLPVLMYVFRLPKKLYVLRKRLPRGV